MNNSLLAHIASKFNSRQYENVANSSVAYLLNEYPTARTVLAKLLRTDKESLLYKTEHHTDNGRFDIAGLDKYRKVQIIIEGKFDAHLTDNQPANYLQELPTGGKLLFLVPEDRIESLQIEIKKRAGDDIVRICFCSWRDILGQIGEENDKSNNPQLTSDLLQIRELCKKMDSESMPPLSGADLDPMNGKRMYHFIKVIEGCKKRLGNLRNINLGGSSPETHGYIFKFSCSDGYKLYGNLGFDNEWWFKHRCPIWLGIWAESDAVVDTAPTDKIADYLKEHAVNFHQANNRGYYGITLNVGDDQAQTIAHIIKETQAVLIHINKKMA